MVLKYSNFGGDYFETLYGPKFAPIERNGDNTTGTRERGSEDPSSSRDADVGNTSESWRTPEPTRRRTA